MKLLSKVVQPIDDFIERKRLPIHKEENQEWIDYHFKNGLSMRCYLQVGVNDDNQTKLGCSYFLYWDIDQEFLKTSPTPSEREIRNYTGMINVPYICGIIRYVWKYGNTTFDLNIIEFVSSLGDLEYNKL